MLPGGGIDPGEDAFVAIVRETREECGLVVRPIAVLARAIQFAYSESERTCFEKRCTFENAEIKGSAQQLETDHVLEWIEDPGQLTIASHRWVLEAL